MIEENKKLKIGILTTFGDLNSSFSLCGVVRQQLIALVKHGYSPVLFVLDFFKDDDLVPEGVEIRKILPQLILEPYGKGDLKNLDADVAKAQKAMEDNMQDIDVMLTHDIIFINSYLPYNIAMRNAIKTKLQNVRWLHWMHSGPSFANLDGSVWDNLYTLPDNSKIVYMNYTDAIRAAEMYHTLPKNVRTIFNPMDIRELHNFSPITKEIIDKNDLMSPEFLCVYALSTTRMDGGGKQLSKVIKIMGSLKQKGFSVALVVPNAHANAEHEKQEIERMYGIAYQYGLERRELVFTSLHDPKYEQGVPHEVVRDLYLLSNIFIFPSVSENCPLVLLEAMASKNILVLNEDFPAFKDFGRDAAIYFRFSSLVAPEPQFPNGEDTYYKDIATLIVDQYEQHKAIKAQTRVRREFNVDWIFEHQLEPAIQNAKQI
jgi:hypothetical protein